MYRFSRRSVRRPHLIEVMFAAGATVALASAMTSIGDSRFQKGDPVWVIEPDGTERAAEYVGELEAAAWFGGAPMVIVVFGDTRAGAQVEVDRVIARDVG